MERTIAANHDLLMLLAALALLACGESAQAADGASSHYVPGIAGDIAMAQSPESGLSQCLKDHVSDLSSGRDQALTDIGVK